MIRVVQACRRPLAIPNLRTALARGLASSSSQSSPSGRRANTEQPSLEDELAAGSGYFEESGITNPKVVSGKAKQEGRDLLAELPDDLRAGAGLYEESGMTDPSDLTQDAPVGSRQRQPVSKATAMRRETMEWEGIDPAMRRSDTLGEPTVRVSGGQPH